MNSFDNDTFLHERKALKCQTEIHVHIACPQSIDIVSDKYLLDEKEMVKSEELFFEKDRNLYQSSHIFLRKILSKYTAIAPEKWKFTHNKYGKPGVNSDDYKWLKFNLSHTHSMIACAIAYQYDVGVDVEHHRPLKDLAGLCRTALSDSERAYVFRFIEPQQQERHFYRYWTLKEACLKAMGKGLSIPLQRISYEVSENGVWRCSIDPEVDNTRYFLSLHLELQEEAYSLALTAKITNTDNLPVVRLFNHNSGRSQCLSFNVLPD